MLQRFPLSRGAALVAAWSLRGDQDRSPYRRRGQRSFILLSGGGKIRLRAAGTSIWISVYVECFQISWFGAFLSTCTHTDTQNSVWTGSVLFAFVSPPLAPQTLTQQGRLQQLVSHILALHHHVLFYQDFIYCIFSIFQLVRNYFLVASISSLLFDLLYSQNYRYLSVDVSFLWFSFLFCFVILLVSFMFC